jgi:hypothetical protein
MLLRATAKMQDVRPTLPDLLASPMNVFEVTYMKWVFWSYCFRSRWRNIIEALVALSQTVQRIQVEKAYWLNLTYNDTTYIMVRYCSSSENMVSRF